ncbi:MAG: hypothetical protein HOW73_09640 [Polyangiaceae bacterium]|nr:hypothetical protein [Polyangiaceae bacterium]
MASKVVRSAARTALTISVLAVAAALLIALVVSLSPSSEADRRWTFTEQASDIAELGFIVPVDRSGAWLLEDHEDATGGRALFNHRGEGPGKPALAVTRKTLARDLGVATRCKVSPGYDERACGVVFRFKDADHYYVARIDDVTKKVVFAVVVGGREHVLQQESFTADATSWQNLRVDAHADVFVVHYNGAALFEVRDLTFSSEGGVGLWVPSAGAAHFDELVVEQHGSSVHPNDLFPFIVQQGHT